MRKGVGGRGEGGSVTKALQICNPNRRDKGCERWHPGNQATRQPGSQVTGCGVGSRYCCLRPQLPNHLYPAPGHAISTSISMPETRSKEPLVWIDCEMTGLDPQVDTILSLACFITDAQLNLLDATGFEAVIRHSQAQLDAMGDWCKSHHGASGLSAACLESSMSAETAAEELFAYIRKYVPKSHKALLAGNSVHADRAFLAKQPYAPVLEYLHHRLLDVSAIKEAARRWAPKEALRKGPQKAGKHEARADILESIEEARYYRKAFFAVNEDGP